MSNTINQIEIKNVIYDIEDTKAQASLNGLSFSVNEDGILEVTYGEEENE